MKCPHCLNHFYPESTERDIEWPGERTAIDSDGNTRWSILTTKCPSCSRLIISLEEKTKEGSLKNTRLIQPKGIARAPLPVEVPPEYTADYQEACAVLPDSAKASAALSRRCLQALLRGEAKVKPGNLADEIQQVLDSGKLPSDLADSIDAVRHIGNFAAHLTKSKNTGEIVDVEPGEAEWNLEVLEELFDFYLVRPTKIAARQAAMNQKLAEAGKKPMKTSKP